MWAAVAQELRRRADSYWHDVHALRAEGEHNAVVIYRTIADELRLIADQLIEIAKRQYDEPVTT